MLQCPECLGLGEVKASGYYRNELRICPKCFGTGVQKEKINSFAKTEPDKDTEKVFAKSLL